MILPWLGAAPAAFCCVSAHCRSSLPAEQNVLPQRGVADSLLNVACMPRPLQMSSLAAVWARKAVRIPRQKRQNAAACP